MTITRSATWETTARSWEMNSIARPKRRRRSASSSRICACTVTSSAVVGSSAISRRGRLVMVAPITGGWIGDGHRFEGFEDGLPDLFAGELRLVGADGFGDLFADGH